MGISLNSGLGPVYASAIQGSRSRQQDAVRVRWLSSDAAWLIVLADGMGGHVAGDLASRIAVDSFVGTFASMREEKAELDAAFQHALQDANARIGTVQSSRPETAGMGTTLVAAHVSNQGLRWISVGDSLLMLYHAGALTRLNEDHSLRALDPEARGGAAPNMLTSALTGTDIRKVDLRMEPVAVTQGDLVIVASDGVLSLPDEQIAKVLASGPPTEVATMTEALFEQVELAAQPRQDNCTIAMFAPGSPPPRARLPWVLRWVIWLGLGTALAAAAAGVARYYHL
jgi:serine/threonine protein phosphatase PrpC